MNKSATEVLVERFESMERRISELEREVSDLKSRKLQNVQFDSAFPDSLNIRTSGDIESIARELFDLASKDSRIDQEKLDWLESEGARKFVHPLKYHIGSQLFSEAYIARTPLEQLKVNYDRFRVSGAHSFVIPDQARLGQAVDGEMR